ncbi:hypothetical protein EJ02DRAFT_470213 [Clathrospora elynae]|uniref:Uncharacterized protein n=1 Tax=Clathrospora elynae TaxID=706981 RepID=A0A6A5SAT2_9PLEO|nr:hypothetical protein EJ02DRAFT_470213 [Clathrospora elynae]
MLQEIYVELNQLGGNLWQDRDETRALLQGLHYQLNFGEGCPCPSQPGPAAGASQSRSTPSDIGISLFPPPPPIAQNIPRTQIPSLSPLLATSHATITPAEAAPSSAAISTAAEATTSARPKQPTVAIDTPRADAVGSPDSQSTAGMGIQQAPAPSAVYKVLPGVGIPTSVPNPIPVSNTCARRGGF